MAVFRSWLCCLSLLVILCLNHNHVGAHKSLSKGYYDDTCPEVHSIVERGVVAALRNGTRMGASLLRLHFHDCFVNGCDGSVLLDDNATFKGEKTALPNNKSIRGFKVVDYIKEELEKVCPRVVSCADILALAARYSVYHLGGPSWKPKLGRRDSLTANRTAANMFIPPPSSNLSSLLSTFAAHGLSFHDLVVLSGAHTIGLSRCTTFRSRIYNDQNINPSFAKQLQSKCPPKAGNDTVLQGLDLKTPNHFDNLYYKDLMVNKGLLHSDQELYNGNKADHMVKSFARDVSKFYRSFSKSMIKMGNINPLTGTQGEIRLHCRRAN